MAKKYYVKVVSDYVRGSQILNDYDTKEQAFKSANNYLNRFKEVLIGRYF